MRPALSAALLAFGLWLPDARADLPSDVGKLSDAFAKSGDVRRLEPRRVERGGVRPLRLPERPPRVQDARRREGATRVSSRRFTPLADGSGPFQIELGAGCHRLHLVAEPGANVDRDADLLRLDGGIVSTDHTESSAATLDTGAGAPRTFVVRFVGAGTAGSVTLLAAKWPLPTGLPARWGPEVCGRMAQALREHHGRGIDRLPFRSSLGAGGITLLPIELEPSGCYVAAVTTLADEPSGIALSAQLGERQAQNHAVVGGGGTAIAFCAWRATRADRRRGARRGHKLARRALARESPATCMLVPVE
jgi:hypothetical protein